MNVERYFKKAYLKLPENKEERDEQIKKFKDIVSMVETMMELDTTNMEEFEITSEIRSPLRKDEVKGSTDRELIFDNTKHREYGYFKLDNIMED